tara:strand:- start:2076 stop:2474 length:399 start_codon:yes stop_codon:yes gene_type:complete
MVNKLEKRKLLEHLLLEKDLRERANSTNLNKCSIYFNSTSNKMTMAHLLAIAAITDEDLSCQTLSTESKTSLTAVCKIINECVAAGWVEQYYKDKKRYVKASNVMLDCYVDYVKFKESCYKNRFTYYKCEFV